MSLEDYKVRRDKFEPENKSKHFAPFLISFKIEETQYSVSSLGISGLKDKSILIPKKYL